MKKAFKIDSTGKIRIWQISVNGDTITEESGLYNGKLVSNITVCKPKNIGKSNESSAEEQAEKEALAKYDKKISKEYFPTIEEARNSEVKLPMLAKDYKKESSKVKFPCFVQPKLDGMRCHANSIKLISRENKEIVTMDHIKSILIKNNINMKLDGELYAHGLTFQENMKLIKKQRPESINVVLHVYDLAISGQSFAQRYKMLTDIVQIINSPIIELVETYVVNNEKEIFEYHKKFLEQGYEGTIIRWGNAEYKFNGRSSNLLKYKDFKDISLEIKDIVPMDVQPTHGLIICEMNGQRFKATPKMSHKEREELLTNKDYYIGKTAEIRYFEETDGGLPRFPVFVGIRLDK